MAEQIESVVTDIGVGAAKTGMLASAAIMAAVAEAVRRLAVAPLVVDPVAASQHGDPLLRPDAIDALRTRIIPLATLVTPNVGEVRLLTGVEVGGPEDALEAARRLHVLGADWVLVKGGHRSGPDATDLLYDGNRTYEFTAPRQATEHTHGSGDTLAAAICAALARGSDMPEAVRLGKAYVTQAITSSYPLGSGLGAGRAFPGASGTGRRRTADRRDPQITTGIAAPWRAGARMFAPSRPVFRLG